MKKLLLIYNPHSGKGKIHSWLSPIIAQLSQAGWLVTACPTSGPGDAVQLAFGLGRDYERVVCCGGDGTLNEVVSGLCQLEHFPALGYIPTGTTNDFSRNLALPKSMEAAAAVAGAGHPVLYDIGQLNQRSFVYIAAFGAFTDVAYDTPQQFKSLFGHLAYVLEGAARLPNLKSYSLIVEHDGQQEEGDFLFGMVSNTVSVGGFSVLANDQVKLDDGLFEVVLIRAPKTPSALQGLIRALATQDPDQSNGSVLGFHAASLTVTCKDPLPWTLDGEFGGSPTVAHIKNHPQALPIVCGKP